VKVELEGHPLEGKELEEILANLSGPTEGIEAYRIKEGGETLGWILYQRPYSTLCGVKILPRGTEALFSALDELIQREGLLGAEIPEGEKEIIDLLISYGFRPLRKIRREGTTFSRLELSTVVFFDRLREPVPRVPYSKERVVVQRVKGDGPREIKEALERLFDGLGGIDRFVQRGQRVVLKPNVVAEHGMRDGQYVGGVVTDKRVLAALIELLLPLASEVIVAEGSSINRSATWKMFEVYGYPELCQLDPKRVRLVDLNSDEAVERPVPGGKRMRSRKVPRTLLEADVIISLPVMKTHFAAVVSLGVKNLQGCMPPLEKYMTHFFGLWQGLTNIHHLIKPKLTIVDGLVAQEGFGPVYGDPKPMGILVGGENPVAVDAVCMRIMGLDPKDSPAVLMAYLDGVGPIEEEKIEVVGASIEEVRSPFRLAEIDLSSGRDFIVHGEGACPGCRGYLHFVLYKLRRPDPKDPRRLLIDRPFKPRVNVYIGPYEGRVVDEGEKNLFIGLCQSHNAGKGELVLGCPPHAEAMMSAIFRLFPDVVRPYYADKTEEAKLEAMLKEVLENLG